MILKKKKKEMANGVVLMRCVFSVRKESKEEAIEEGSEDLYLTHQIRDLTDQVGKMKEVMEKQNQLIEDQRRDFDLMSDRFRYRLLKPQVITVWSNIYWHRPLDSLMSLESNVFLALMALRGFELLANMLCKWDDIKQVLSLLGKRVGCSTLDSIDWMFDHGADINAPNIYNETFFMNSVRNCKPEYVGKLLDCGANIFETVLSYVWNLSQGTYIRLLKASPNHVVNPPWGRTQPLHSACYYAQPEKSKILLMHGALPTTKDNRGMTALDHINTGFEQQGHDESTRDQMIAMITPWMSDPINTWRKEAMTQWPKRLVGAAIRLRKPKLYRDLIHCYMVWNKLKEKHGLDPRLRHVLGKAMIAVYGGEC